MKDRERTEASLLRPLRLIDRRGQWLAAPTPGEAGRDLAKTFEPFVLPRLPESLLQWCTIVGDRVWSRRRRCLAVLLLLCCRSGRWTLRLPAQRCGSDDACWTVATASIPGLPDDVWLGGTFQTRVIAPSEHPADAIPPVPGMHFMQGVGTSRDAGKVWTFIRMEGPARLVEPSRLVVSDWSVTVDEALPRLRLA